MEKDMPFNPKNVFIKKPATTSDKFGKYPHLRTVNELINSGVVVIDKPSGPSSHQVSSYVKDILKLKKTGHSGTLDPKVTGVLPVALEKGTRIVQSLLIAGKEYIALMYLHKKVSNEEIIKCFNKFTGKINQLPPVKSAVKRQIRERTIYYMDIIEIKDQFVVFKVGCQAGTYIRKLIHDMGKEIGVNAQMADLRRTKAGPFTEENAVTLQTLNDAFYYFEKNNNSELLKKIIHPLEDAITHLPKIYLFDTTIDTICHGALLKVPGICALDKNIDVGASVALMTLKGELVSVARSLMSSKDIMDNERGAVARSEQVFLPVNTYPRYEKTKIEAEN